MYAAMWFEFAWQMVVVLFTNKYAWYICGIFLTIKLISYKVNWGKGRF